MALSDDVTLECVLCPECAGHANPPPNGTTRGCCWLCLGSGIVTQARATEAFRISQSDITPPTARAPTQAWRRFALALALLWAAWWHAHKPMIL